ncbi:MAG: D-alanyl-D-alanine carboxypeptidase family protein [Opitutaceae bacterium]|nr:D-alanyl-D-alanine carboxypeptidase family protein [Opitutaceae bacterium]
MSLSAALSSLHRDLGISPTYGADRHLTAYAEAVETELEQIALNDDGRPIRLVPAAAEAWRRMSAAATRDGIELLPVSGFRSIARQTEIIRAKLEAGRPLDAILRYVAAPGFSEHHTGRALDISSPGHTDLEEAFEHTPAFQWLARHAPSFGFTLTYPRGNDHGIGYEPWHWCWHARKSG